MFKEILNIIPKLSTKELEEMEKSLGARFKRIAKSFGKGLLGVLTGAGGAGIALALIDKLLNPLKQVQDAIEKSLHAGEDLADQADQFNTSAGELAKLQAFGKAKGLDSGEIRLLLTKFQSAVSDAIADPTKHSAVKNFTGEKNTAQAFLNFIENLKALDKVDKNRAIEVQKEVFGEKQIGRVSNFLNADFDKLSKEFQAFDAAKITKANKRLEELAGQANLSEAKRGLKDIPGKANSITEGTIAAIEKSKDIAQAREDEKIKQTESLAKLQLAADTFMQIIEAKGLPLIGQLVGKIEEVATQLQKIAGSRFMKYFKSKDKGD